MARRIFCFLLVQSSICKVFSIYAQPTIQQYLHLTGSPHSTNTITVPTTQHPATTPNLTPANQLRPATGLPSFSGLALPELVSRIQQLPASQQTALQNQLTNQAIPSTGLASLSALALPELVSRMQQLPATQPTALQNQLTNPAIPSTGLPSFSALGLPNLVSSLQQFPNQKYSEIKPANPSSSIDSNLLNNLAIALQLLIVSNILNSPPPTDPSAAKAKEISTCVEPNHSHFVQAQVAMPNSKFIGSSSFAEPNIAQAYRPTKKSMSLMSPYEALAPNSPYSDPILSQYASTNPRQDFQSPYSMMTDQDVFSMSDLF